MTAGFSRRLQPSYFTATINQAVTSGDTTVSIALGSANFKTAFLGIHNVTASPAARGNFLWANKDGALHQACSEFNFQYTSIFSKATSTGLSNSFYSSSSTAIFLKSAKIVGSNLEIVFNSTSSLTLQAWVIGWCWS